MNIISNDESCVKYGIWIDVLTLDQNISPYSGYICNWKKKLGQ